MFHVNEAMTADNVDNGMAQYVDGSSDCSLLTTISLKVMIKVYVTDCKLTGVLICQIHYRYFVGVNTELL